MNRHPEEDSQQQTCKVCGRPDKFDFNLPDAVWRSCLPEQYWNRVVCLYCFDEYASIQEVDYTTDLNSLYFAGKQVAICFITEPPQEQSK